MNKAIDRAFANFLEQKEDLIRRYIMPKFDHDGKLLCDAVNEPSHYNNHPKGFNVGDMVEHLSYWVGQAVAYCHRAGSKSDNPVIQEYKKAIKCLEREIQRLTQEEENQHAT